jgi:tRNA(Ile)-lysidine synthase
LTAVHQQVRRTIRRHDLCPPGSRLLVGLSGGSDSVALTLLLQELAERCGFVVAAAAHLNHRLRAAASGDEAFCREFAARAGLPIVIDAVDVQAYAAAERLSVEEAARRARYTFLHRAAADQGADRIAVGHTRDDQAETFLLKLIRGAGLSGLGGIYPRRGVIVRPLLDVARADLRAYLAGRSETWVEDESNEWVGNPRNRIRHRVLPELDLAYGGAARPSIARTAHLAREDGQWLDELGQRRLDELGVRAAEGLEFDAPALGREPLPIRRRVLWLALKAVAGNREVGLEHVETALDVLAGECAGADLPGCRMELRRGKLVLRLSGQGWPRSDGNLGL